MDVRTPRRKLTDEEKESVRQRYTLVDFKKEYPKKVKEILELQKALFKLTAKVYSLPKGAGIVWKDLPQITQEQNAVVTRSDLKSLNSMLGEKTLELNKYVKFSGKKGHRGITGGALSQNYPIRVSDKMSKFFDEVYLGEEFDKAGIATLINDGITTNSILTYLFMIYTYANDLQDPEIGNIVHVMNDPIFQKYFGEDLHYLESRDVKEERKNTQGQRVFFNPLQFKMANFKQIASLNTIKPETTEERQSEREQLLQQYKEVLEAEKQYTQEVNAQWKELRKEQVEARRKKHEERRKAKKMTAHP